jgi:hypothetical protein
MGNGPGLPRRVFLAGLLLALFGRALSLPSLLGKAGWRVRRGQPTIGVDLAKVPGGDHSTYTRVIVRGRANTGPAILSLSNGDLAPGWTAEDEARWHGAGA